MNHSIPFLNYFKKQNLSNKNSTLKIFIIIYNTILHIIGQIKYHIDPISLHLKMQDNLKF